MIKKYNFTKWLAFSFPYIASLLYEIVLYFFDVIIKMPLGETTEQTIFLLINSLAILFGIKIIGNYTHTDNCENYSPKTKGFSKLK